MVEPSASGPTGASALAAPASSDSQSVDASDTSRPASAHSAGKQVEVINSGARGLGEHAKQTLDAMQAEPKLAGGLEAAVGSAKGEQPEVVVETRDRSNSSDSKLSWLKKFATKATGGGGSRESINEQSDSVVPGAAPLSSEEQDRVITDQHGDPVPVVSSPAEADKDSVVSSVKDDILEDYDVDPAVSNRKFHKFFSAIPLEESLIETYVCALVRDIAIAGRLYVSEHHVAFRANIFGFQTSVSIPFSEITTIEKRSTAKLIGNAIEVVTLHSRHTFTNLLKRDSCYDLLVAVWRHEHPEEERLRERSDSDTTGETDDKRAEARSEVTFEDDHGLKKKHKFKDVFNGKLLKSMSIASRDTIPEGMTPAEKVKEQALLGELGHQSTEYDGQEYSHEIMDIVLPTSPAKAYDLLFKNQEFLRPFLENTMGLKELNLGDWQDTKREMDYIKPLNSSIGPKQTHCYVVDETELDDPEVAIADVTTTKTPDVPSGNDFSTMTKTVLTWSEQGGARVHVTSDVEWTKVNRMLRGIIERSCIDGQKKYHADLETAARDYIDAHKSDFEDEGVTTTFASSAKEGQGEESATTTNPDARPAYEHLVEKLTTPSPTMFLVLALIVLVLTNFWTLMALRHQARAAHGLRLGHPGEVASAVSRVLDDFASVYDKSGRAQLGKGQSSAHVKNELEALVSAVHQAQRGLNEVTDRIKGLHAHL